MIRLLGPLVGKFSMFYEVGISTNYIRQKQVSEGLIVFYIYRVTHQVVPYLSNQGLCNSHTGPESRVWEQPDVSPCT